MTYDEIVTYIEDIPKFTKKTTLAHTDRILDVLGRPDRALKILHVAGTNGKGSTCSYLSAMLQEGGYKVGLFTSPHLVRINERFMINGEPVSDEMFTEAFLTVRSAYEQTMAAGDEHPTYFETLFLMGVVIFAREKVDYTVLEVGMGGCLDATNVVEKPLACVITSISLDHTMYLGETVPEIASQKAGIIKPGVPVVYDAHDPAAAEVIAARAAELGSPAYPLVPQMYEALRTTRDGVVFDFYPEGRDAGCAVRLQIPQVAAYQMMNASLAFLAMQLLSAEHQIPQEKLVRGISRMNWPCRMETVMEGVVIDGAHNPDGIAQFVEAVEHFHKDSEITLLFSAVADKRYKDMIRELQEGIRPDRVVTTCISGSREVSEEEFARLFREAGCPEVFSDPSPARAFDIARALKGDGMLFCVGSLYLAGEIKAYCSSMVRN